MRIRLLGIAAGIGLTAGAALAQAGGDTAEFDYVASTPATAYGQQAPSPPLIGLRRKADFIVVTVSFASDSRDALTRRQEIFAMLLDALGKSAAAGLGLATGGPVLAPLTRTNYEDVSLGYAGREDTSKADVMITVPLTGTPQEAEMRVDTFVRSLKRTGRGTITNVYGSRRAGIRNPGQYRAQIVSLVAADARANAEAFGPDYRALVDGLDRPVQWVQVSDSDVFLYLPYSYRIGAR